MATFQSHTLCECTLRKEWQQVHIAKALGALKSLSDPKDTHLRPPSTPSI